jgi:hypothetical protein
MFAARSDGILRLEACLLVGRWQRENDADGAAHHAPCLVASSRPPEPR